jgi:hypothetical protein
MLYTNTKNGETVASGLGLVEAMEVVERVAGDFARKLVEQERTYQLQCRLQGTTFPRGYWALKGNQIFWLHKLAQEQLQREARPVEAAQPRGENFAAVRDLLQAARDNGKQFPKLKIALGGQVVVFALAGAKSKNPGGVNVTDGGKYPANVFFGRILTDGTWQGSPRAEGYEAVVNFLRELNMDPATIASREGHRSGCCCFCGEDLTASTVGYGPVCARRHGLPYDNVKMEAGRQARAQRKAAKGQAGVAVVEAEEEVAHDDEQDPAAMGEEVALQGIALRAQRMGLI